MTREQLWKELLANREAVCHLRREIHERLLAANRDVEGTVAQQDIDLARIDLLEDEAELLRLKIECLRQEDEW